MNHSVNPDKILISCSENHAAAVGAYGHLYVWGSNLGPVDNEVAVEGQKPKKDLPLSDTEFYYQLGFVDSEICEIPKPVFYKLQHPLYSPNVVHVACGNHFTAVIAIEKENAFELDDEIHDTEDLFYLEIQDVMTEVPPPDCKVKPESYAKAFLANQVRKVVEDYLRNNNLSFIDMFKSGVIKEKSFIDIMKINIKSSISKLDLKKFIDNKKMRLPGKGIILKPLYEMVMKCRQSKGFMYILGRNDKLVPNFQGHMLSVKMRHETVGYHLISLPEKVSCAKVACGEDFVLLLSHSGMVYTWGSQHSLALGRNRMTTFGQIKPITELTSEKSGIKDIACGDRHCFALSTSNILFSWGEGTFGKLGNGRQDSIARPEPVSINNRDIVMIRAGHNSSFCKTKEKICYGWGDISNNKFGYCSKEHDDRPYLFSYDFEVSDVAIGSKGAVFISKQGLLYQYSELEYNLSCLNKKYKHLEGTQFFQVSAHKTKYFALSTKGTVFSWASDGDNSLLGRNNSAEIPFEISSCSHHFCTKDFEEEIVSVENIPKESSSRIVKVCCSEENTALLTDKGEAIICGSNKVGQMGIAFGDLDDEEEVVDHLSFRIIPRLSMDFKVSLTMIACGLNHMLGINAEGKVLSWGANSFGQLGRKNFSICEKYPEIIKSLEEVNAVMVSAGHSHSMVLSSKHEIFVFGSSEHGKLGLGMQSSASLISTPTLIQKIPKMSLISCGGEHSLSLCEDGTLFLWGYGWNGQLGSGLKESFVIPKPLLITVTWKYATCGSNHTVAISTEGITYHWGETCLADEETELLSPCIVRGISDVKMKKVYASQGHSAGIIELGTSVYTWGKQIHKRILSAKPEIEDGTCTRTNNTPMPYGEKILDFSLGPYHGAFITDQGRLFTWGYSKGGRLGDEKDSENKCKVYNAQETELKILQKAHKEDEKPDEYIGDLQKLLQDEPEELNENNIREVDTQIISKFNECIDAFVKIASKDSTQEGFFLKVEHKQLTRLQQEPFRCQYHKLDMVNPEIKNRQIGYGSLVTTFQIHCCYMEKLFDLKIKLEKKMDLLNMIYSDMENDSRLMYTAIYLSRLLLDKTLKREEISFPEFLDHSESAIYRKLIFKIITANEYDMERMRKLAAYCIHSLSGVVHDDENGIDPDPLHTPKVASINPITAYQINRNLVDRRMIKLIQVLQYFVDGFKKYDSFSDSIYLIIKDLLVKCKEKFGINIKNFDPLNKVTWKIIHTVLSIVFEPFIESLKNPYHYHVLVDVDFHKTESNFTSLSNSIQAFFAGKQLGDSRWLQDINTYILSDENLLLKIETVTRILDKKSDLEEMYLESVFVNSLASHDKIITVPGQLLVYLHSVVHNNLEDLRVNNPSYDPLAIINRVISPVPSPKIFTKNECLNLNLLTRSLRQDQSIVRCPNCEMLIPRDMSPNNFGPVIELYDPMPPNSSESILTYILKTGPKKQKKARIDDYIRNYQDNYFNYLKNFEITEKVKILINNVDTANSANFGIAIEAADEEQRKGIEKNREIFLKIVENMCESQYKRRKQHCLLQYKISRTLNHLFHVLSTKMENSFIEADKKKKILFNIEYGASNTELEEYSDSVMFSIYMNKIKEYTTKKEMSINLFENLTEDMKDSLRGFMKRSLGELVKKKIVKEYSLSPEFKSRNIVFSFEVDKDNLIVIATNSPNKLNICGRDEFRQEEVLLYEKLNSDEIAQMREECKETNKVIIKTLPEKKNLIEVKFVQIELLNLIGKMEDKVAAYLQNIKISNSVKQDKKVNFKPLETVETEEFKTESNTLLNNKKAKEN